MSADAWTALGLAISGALVLAGVVYQSVRGQSADDVAKGYKALLSDVRAEVEGLKTEVAGLRSENRAAFAYIRVLVAVVRQIAPDRELPAPPTGLTRDLDHH